MKLGLAHRKNEGYSMDQKNIAMETENEAN